MNRRTFASFLITGLVGILLAPTESPRAAVPPSNVVKVALNGHNFTLPAGFEIELIAGPPQVQRPVAAAFGADGTLYATESSGTNDPVQKQLAEKPHQALRLKADRTGKFTEVKLFADKLMMPQGIMVSGDSVYIGTPPSIWKFSTDGTKPREEWFNGKTLTGCTNDLHGPYLGIDGWIYWTKGAFATQTYTLPNGKPFKTRAAHIFRSRPDATNLEPMMTGGMDNPVDVVFTPTGDRIFTTTFLQHPGDGKRDGLIHAIYGGLYGKDHEALSVEHTGTSPHLMPVLTHLGAAAPCGLHRYESTVFGTDYRDNLFACSFNMHKVTRHILIPTGATYRTQDSDFLVSDNLDFHPTDVIEDADGSLIVVDTGGWYKLCCPTSAMAKNDIFGAIYRIHKTGVKPIADPRGLQIDWSKLPALESTKYLDDPRPVVRQRVIETLGNQPETAMSAIETVVRESKSVEAKRNALWAASRFELASSQGQGKKLARMALADSDESVRQVALHILSLYPDKIALVEVAKQLKTGTPANRRLAAEVLGRIGDKSSVPALLESLPIANDQVLHHAITYALVEIGDGESTRVGLSSLNTNVVRGALAALNSMPNGLSATDVLHVVNSPDEPLRDTAWWVLSKHPEWSDAVGKHFVAVFKAKPPTVDELTKLAKFAKTEPVQKLFADWMTSKDRTPDERRAVMLAVAASGLKTMPIVWLDAVTSTLTEGDVALYRDALMLCRSLPLPKTLPVPLAHALTKAGSNAKLPQDVRFAALALNSPNRLEPALFTELLAAVHRDQSATVRTPAATVLSRVELDAKQLLELTRAIATTGPMELDKLLEPFARNTDEPTALALMTALKDSPLRSSLRSDMLKSRLAKHSEAVRTNAEILYATLNVDAAAQKTKLQELVTTLKDGDVRRGQVVFNSPKAACITCHAIGYLGGKLGPDLTRIGGIRSERDLLEAIVFPNASFVRSYEPVHVTTHDGRVFNGILKKDAPDEVILAVSATEEVRLARADIDEFKPGAVSVMPSGLDQQLTKQELADLVAFLKASK